MTELSSRLQKYYQRRANTNIVITPFRWLHYLTGLPVRQGKKNHIQLAAWGDQMMFAIM